MIKRCFACNVLFREAVALISIFSRKIVRIVTERVLSPMIGSPIFHTKLLECIIRSQCQTWPVITGLLLLTAFFAPLAIRRSSLEYSWCHGRPIVSCVCLSSLVVLDKDLWCWFAIISDCFKPSLAHNQAYFTLTPSQFILFKVYPCPPTTPTSTHGEARLIQSSSSEPQLRSDLKWWETLFPVFVFWMILKVRTLFKQCENFIHIAAFIGELQHFKNLIPSYLSTCKWAISPFLSDQFTIYFICKQINTAKIMQTLYKCLIKTLRQQSVNFVTAFWKIVPNCLLKVMRKCTKDGWTISLSLRYLLAEITACRNANQKR